MEFQHSRNTSYKRSGRLAALRDCPSHALQRPGQALGSMERAAQLHGRQISRVVCEGRGCGIRSSQGGRSDGADRSGRKEQSPQLPRRNHRCGCKGQIRLRDLASVRSGFHAPDGLGRAIHGHRPRRAENAAGDQPGQGRRAGVFHRAWHPRLVTGEWRRRPGHPGRCADEDLHDGDRARRGAYVLVRPTGQRGADHGFDDA